VRLQKARDTAKKRLFRRGQLWQCRWRVEDGHEQVRQGELVVNPKIFPIMLVTAIAMGATAQQASDAAETGPANASQTTAANKASDDADAAATVALIAKANAAAAKAATTAAATAANKEAGDAALAKKAIQFGWRPETQHGNSVYCRDDPVIGSRFKTRRCVGPVQLAGLLEQAEFEKERLKQHACGGNCGSPR